MVLLIDAAGPVSIVGLLKGTEWLSWRASGDDFLAWFQPALNKTLGDVKMQLNDLSAIYYGSGPGSTLGLRLSALFVRTLLKVPELAGLSCYQYHNLEAAICATGHTEGLVAPWRRDNLHLCIRNLDTGTFSHGEIKPEMAAERALPGILLGKRIPDPELRIAWQPYPADQLPGIFHQNPSLLRKTSKPVPYTLEVPEFAKWNPQRHPAK